MEENVPIETVPAPDVEEAWPLPPRRAPRVTPRGLTLLRRIRRTPPITCSVLRSSSVEQKTVAKNGLKQ